MFESASFCFLTMLLKKSVSYSQMDAIKHIYRVGRAADHQNATDMENYENRPLNKPITAVISQHT